MKTLNTFDSGCPKCGGTSGYALKVRALGHTTHHGQWDLEGAERIADDSELRMVSDKSVTCLDCGKRTYLKTLRQ